MVTLRIAVMLLLMFLLPYQAQADTKCQQQRMVLGVLYDLARFEHTKMNDVLTPLFYVSDDDAVNSFSNSLIDLLNEVDDEFLGSNPLFDVERTVLRSAQAILLLEQTGTAHTLVFMVGSDCLQYQFQIRSYDLRRFIGEREVGSNARTESFVRAFSHPDFPTGQNRGEAPQSFAYIINL